MSAISPPSIYLDYNATAPLLPSVAERMVAAAARFVGNPSSPHRFGQEARNLVEGGRRGLARLLGQDRRGLVFTSGGTEGNNTVLRWLAEIEGPAHLIASPIEHPSILRCCEWLARRGVAVSYLPVDGQGRIVAAAIEEQLRPETRLVTVMAANNETGVLQPVGEVARLLRRAQGDRPILLHTDAVQAFGRIPLPLREWGVDAATVTAHKLGGPKGIGALVLAEGSPIPPLLLGGRQEGDRRAGTESVFLIEGFLAAAEWVFAHFAPLNQRLTALRDRLLSALQGTEGFFLNGDGAERLPNTANLGFEGVSAQSLLTALDLEGIALSSGSACSSGAVEPSHVLRAMGLPRERVEASVRISLGHATTEAEIDRCAELLLDQARRIRRARQPRQASA